MPSTDSQLNSWCNFSDHQIRSGLKNKRQLGRFVNELIATITKKESGLQYTFVSDEFLLQMNQEYLQHDTYTDIITFDLSTQHDTILRGDIYISVDRVRENARQMHVRYADELLRVILHGALHLSGFGDKTPHQAKKMRAQEEMWMQKYFDLRTGNP